MTVKNCYLDFDFYFRSDQGKCLFNIPSTAYAHNLWAEPPGRLLDEHMQCKMAFGQQSQFCDVSYAKVILILKSTINSGWFVFANT